MIPPNFEEWRKAMGHEATDIGIPPVPRPRPPDRDDLERLDPGMTNLAVAMIQHYSAPNGELVKAAESGLAMLETIHKENPRWSLAIEGTMFQLQAALGKVKS